MENFIEKTDYTNLSRILNLFDMIELCSKANAFKVASICIQPEFVPDIKSILTKKQSTTKVCTVISFPHGNDHTSKKEVDTYKALKEGADEIDVVLDYNMIIDIDKGLNRGLVYTYLKDQVQKLTKICNLFGATLKVIVESGLLTEKETTFATEICIDGGAHYIKTSTGKVKMGAELDKMVIMSNTIHQHDSKMKIKASGGIRTMADVERYIGIADRLGIGSQSADELYREYNS